jgi:hypothetical protein
MSREIKSREIQSREMMTCHVIQGNVMGYAIVVSLLRPLKPYLTSPYAFSDMSSLVRLSLV